MSIKNRLYLFFTFIALAHLSLAASVDVKCTFKNVPSEELIQKLKKENTQIANDLNSRIKPHRWWQFDSVEPINFNELSLSIDGENGKILTESELFKYTMKINLESIIVRQYFLGSFSPQEQHATLDTKYYISRIDGLIFGRHYAADGSYSPYFKQGDYMWDISGKCWPIKRLF